MELENLKLKDLKPLEKNVRRHSEKQIEEFVKSIKLFGQIRPFVIDEDNTVLVGNGMLEAMKRAKLKKCTAYRVKGLTELQKKKLVLTDNKIYSLGGDDLDNIEDFIKELGAAGDFEIPGFDEESLKALSQTADEILNEAMTYGQVEEVQGKPYREPETSPQDNAEDLEPETPRNASVLQSDEPEGVTHGEETQTVICANCGEVIRL